MEEYSMRVLHVNKKDSGGGAARIAFDLVNGMSNLGIKSDLVVDIKSSKHEFVHEIKNDKWRNPWTGFWEGARNALNEKNIRIIPRLAGWMGSLGEPVRIVNRLKGIEDFNFPGTHQLLKNPVDIIHLHNLHTDYFDLRKLPQISRKFPTVITLHDAWLLTGHCAHFLSCRRWKLGCGECPDLKLYPEILRDGTNFNWARKKQIYEESEINLVTPSEWLMDQVEESILVPALKKKKVINNGIDLNLFVPGDKIEARNNLGLPLDREVILFVGNGYMNNPYKNFSMIQKAITNIAHKNPEKKLLAINLGENIEEEYQEVLIDGTNTILRHFKYQDQPGRLVDYYRGADVFIHAAFADVFPLVIIEAMACGLPVIATGVGGIPEQVHDGETGYIVTPGDELEMGAVLEKLLDSSELRENLGDNAAAYARDNFGLDLMLTRYLEFYQDVYANWKNAAKI